MWRAQFLWRSVWKCCFHTHLHFCLYPFSLVPSILIWLNCRYGVIYSLCLAVHSVWRIIFRRCHFWILSLQLFVQIYSPRSLPVGIVQLSRQDKTWQDMSNKLNFSRVLELWIQLWIAFFRHVCTSVKSLESKRFQVTIVLSLRFHIVACCLPGYLTVKNNDNKTNKKMFKVAAIAKLLSWLFLIII